MRQTPHRPKKTHSPPNREQPVLPVNRGLASQESLIEVDSTHGHREVQITVKLPQDREVHFDTTEHSILVSCDSSPPICQALEMPRAIASESLKVERHADRVVLTAQYLLPDPHLTMLPMHRAMPEHLGTPDHPRSESCRPKSS